MLSLVGRVAGFKVLDVNDISEFGDMQIWGFVLRSPGLGFAGT